MAERYKFPDGTELLIGLDIYGRWCVSFWDENLNIVWRKLFSNQSEAKSFYESQIK